MSGEHPDPFALERVPDITIVIVVSREQDPAGDGEGDRGDPAEDAVVGVRVELAIRAEVEKLALCVVRAGRECIAIGEEPRKSVIYTR